MLALQMAQQGDGLQRAVFLQKREKVALLIVFKGISHRAPVNNLSLRRRCQVGTEASGSPFAVPGADRRCALTMV